MAMATIGMSAQNKNLNKKEYHQEMKSNLTPEQRVDLRLKKMTNALDLSADQQVKMKQLFLEKGTERSEMYKNRRQMTDLERQKAKQAMLDRKMGFKTKMSEILTKEQVTKWESLQSERRGKEKGRINHKNKIQN